MRRLLAAFLVGQLVLSNAAPAIAEGGWVSGGVSGSPATSQGGSANVVARFDCRSFGQTASGGQASPLAIKYATPIMCWASASTVQGVNVNGTGWVPEVFFEWTWGDDNGLDTVSVGGLTVDLGEAIGLVAATAFKPTTNGETCGGGADNSLQTITLRVTSLVNGVRESDEETLNVCIENKDTTWATTKTVVYCDEANCADDAGAPAGATNGGNIAASGLATALQKCGTDGATRRILLEGGVSFIAPSVSIQVGSQSCYVSSYGTGRAELKFTSASVSTAIAATHANCAGYRLDNVTFAGNGASSPTLIGGGANTGCYAIIDSDVSQTPGEELYALSIVNPPGATVQTEGYYIKFDFTRSAGNDTQAYIYGDYTAFVGGKLAGLTQAGGTSNNNIRLPQWNRVAIDAMDFRDGTSHVVTPRQDCGGLSSCPNFPSASMLTISRSYSLQGRGIPGTNMITEPFEVCSSGSGSEQTKCYDIEFLSNVFAWVAGPTEPDDYIAFQGGAAAGSEIKRVRIFQNAHDISAQDSTFSRMVGIGVASQVAIIGNTQVDTGAFTTARTIANGSSSAIDIAKDNVCFDAGGFCNQFPSITESVDNKTVTVNPFSVSPGQLTAFDFSDVTIAATSPLCVGAAISGIPTDVQGDTIPKSGDECAGVDNE